MFPLTRQLHDSSSSSVNSLLMPLLNPRVFVISSFGIQFANSVLYIGDDAIDQDHVWPTAKGGRDVYQNPQLVHRTCHHRKTRWDNQGWCPIRPWGSGKRQEKSRVKGKLSRTVLKAGESS